MFSVDGIVGFQEYKLNILFFLASSLDVHVSVFPLLLDVLIPILYTTAHFVVVLSPTFLDVCLKFLFCYFHDNKLLL